MMDFHFENRKVLNQFIAEEVMTAKEASEYLDISHQALISLLQRGKVKPFKEAKNVKLFFKSALEECREDAEKFKKNYWI